MIKIYKINALAQLPERATPGSAGYDLRSVMDAELFPGQFMAVRTGLALGLPRHVEAQIRPRSGLAASRGVTVLNAPGTIDPDYVGELKVVLINHGPVMVRIAVGDRIAQLVFAPIVHMPFESVESLDVTERGVMGFGSTGVA